MPGAAPQDVQAIVRSSSSITVQWLPPPMDKHHGQIIYYKVRYQEVEEHLEEENPVVLEKLYEISSESQNLPYELTIEHLQKWTTYRIQILAGTKVGDGPLSDPIDVRTKEDGKNSFPLCSLLSSESH